MVIFIKKLFLSPYRMPNGEYKLNHLAKIQGIVIMELEVIVALCFVALACTIQNTRACVDCDYDELELFENIDSSLDESSINPEPRIIFPGTKWCGPGDIAKHSNDLGTLADVDRCCRDHDKCDDIILSGEQKYGLKNPDPYTRLHCKCDRAFQSCLRNLNQFIASAIGTLYSTVRRYCFMFEYPIKKCIKYQGTIVKRCIKYKLDRTKPKVWQWFDIPLF